MDGITSTEEIVFSYSMREYLIEILYLEYSGGGECWEWRVSKAGVTRHQSEDGYGSPEPAARDAFGWLVDND